MIPLKEHVSYAPEASFTSLLRGWPRIDCSYHLHEEYELTHVVTSEGTLLAGDGISEFKAGDVFLFGSNLPHIFRNWPGLTYGKTGASTHVIQFRYGFLGGAFFDAPEMRKIKALLDRSARGFHLTGKLAQKVAAAMLKLHKSKDAHRITSLLDVLETAASSPKNLTVLSNSPGPAAGGSVDQRLEKVLGYIYDHLGVDVTFDEAVKLSCMTPSAFSRLFRRTTLLSFTEFVNRLRISNACRLLIGSDHSITQIAFESGFENLSYFNRQFKAQTGQSPRAFRTAANG